MFHSLIRCSLAAVTSAQKRLQNAFHSPTSRPTITAKSRVTPTNRSTTWVSRTASTNIRQSLPLCQATLSAEGSINRECMFCKHDNESATISYPAGVCIAPISMLSCKWRNRLASFKPPLCFTSRFPATTQPHPCVRSSPICKRCTWAGRWWRDGSVHSARNRLPADPSSLRPTMVVSVPFSGEWRRNPLGGLSRTALALLAARCIAGSQRKGIIIRLTADKRHVLLARKQQALHLVASDTVHRFSTNCAHFLHFPMACYCCICAVFAATKQHVLTL